MSWQNPIEVRDMTKRQKFPKCQCGHNFSDHQKHSGYFGYGGWCRKCAEWSHLKDGDQPCDHYDPLEWRKKL